VAASDAKTIQQRQALMQGEAKPGHADETNSAEMLAETGFGIPDAGFGIVGVANPERRIPVPNV